MPSNDKASTVSFWIACGKCEKFKPHEAIIALAEPRGWQLSLPNQGLWIPAGYFPTCIFFSIVGTQKIRSNFSAIHNYVRELRNHHIISFKSLVSCDCTLKLSFGDEKELPLLERHNFVSLDCSKMEMNHQIKDRGH